MKNLLILIVFSLTAFACNEEKVTITKEEFNRLIKDSSTQGYPKPFELYDSNIDHGGSGIVLASDEHEYIIDKKGYHGRVVLHWIECERCNSRTDSLRKNDSRLLY